MNIEEVLKEAAIESLIISKKQKLIQYDSFTRSQRVGHFVTSLRRKLKDKVYRNLLNTYYWEDICIPDGKDYLDIREQAQSALKQAKESDELLFFELESNLKCINNVINDVNKINIQAHVVYEEIIRILDEFK